MSTAIEVIVGLFVLGIASALVPLITIEAALAVAATDGDLSLVLVATAAAMGQIVGKVVWYYAGTSSTSLPTIRKKLEDPRWRASLEKWRGRTHGRPWTTAGLLFVSAFVGLPPYAVVAVLAGVLRVPMTVFVGVGLVGRFLRFWVVLELSSYTWVFLG